MTAPLISWTLLHFLAERKFSSRGREEYRTYPWIPQRCLLTLPAAGLLNSAHLLFPATCLSPASGLSWVRQGMSMRQQLLLYRAPCLMRHVASARLKLNTPPTNYQCFVCLPAVVDSCCCCSVHRQGSKFSRHGFCSVYKPTSCTWLLNQLE